MNNRLAELGNTNWADSDDEMEANGGGGDVEMGDVKKQPTHMDHFFREVEDIKKDIEGVKSATRKIGEINEAALQATTTEEETQLSNQLKPLIDKTNKRAKATKNMLGLLKEENKKLKEDGTGKGSDIRFVSNHTRDCPTLCWSSTLLLTTSPSANPFTGSARICATHSPANSLTK